MNTGEQDFSAETERGGWKPDGDDGRDTVSSRQDGDEEISGLIRRVRRLAKVSQRELANELDVSQSAVAKWETGRTAPSVRMMVRILAVADLGLAAARRGGEQDVTRPALQGRASHGERVLPMKPVAARDAAHRRYPAHAFVWAEGWWAPQGSETTVYFSSILDRSEDLGLPRVRYSRWWQRSRPPSPTDIDDHPTWTELVAEAREGWQPGRGNVLSIPEWALQDSKKSRNRRPDEFRELARRFSPMSSRQGTPGAEAIRRSCGSG